jgi:multidrug resistance efflux pump
MPSNRRTRLKVIGLVLVLIIAAVAVYFTVLRKEAAPDYIETTGVMEATEVELSPKIAGKIEWLCCAEGDPINAGTRAVRLDSRELKARVDEAKASILEAEKTIAESEVNLENSKALEEAASFDAKASEAEVDRTKALVNDAKDNLDRAKGLFKDGFLSKKDLDSAQTAYDANNAQFQNAMARRSGSYAGLKNAAANIRAALARISTAKARKAGAEAQLKVAMAQLNDTDIICPIDGVVVYKSYELGEYVNPGVSIYTVDDLKNVWARVDIEETSVDKVKLGAKALVFTPGQPEKPFESRIIEVGVVGGFATQRDVTRGRPDIKTFRVKAGIIKPDGSLKPGMTVRVRVFFGK